VDADIGTTVQAYDSTMVVDADIGVSVQAYDADIPVVVASQAEMEAGTVTANRTMNPAGVKQAIDALGTSTLNSNITGLTPSNAVDTDHDITIAAGTGTDSTTTTQLTLSSSITKQIDAAWAAGDNLGGLFTGTVALDTTYHLFIIKKDSDSSIDAGFDTSLTAANIPAGYTAYRRVSSFLTDASANLIAYIATEALGGGLFIDLLTRIEDVNYTTPGSAAITVTLSIPSGVKHLAHINVWVNDSTSGNVIYTSLDQLDVAPSSTNNDLRVSNGCSQASTNMNRMTNTSAQMRVRATAITYSNFKLRTLGWTDFRR